MSQQISPTKRGDLDQYRQAIRYCLARTDMDEFFVSLELGGLYELATWQPELMTIYEEETAPKNLTLELHLQGGSISEHKAPALAASHFITHTTEAIQKAAKYSGSGLMIEPFFTGSLGVKISTPPEAFDETAALFDEPVDTSLALSVRTIANLFSQAARNESLDAILFSLPDSAKQSLSQSLRIVHDNGWNIDGSLTQRSRRVEPVHLSTSSVELLLDSLTGNQSEPRKTVTVWQAVLDGYRSSLNCVYLKHDGKVRKLDVFDRQVLAEANKLPAGTKVEAEVEEHEPQSPSGAKYSYLLLNIRPLDRELRSET